MGWGLSGGGLDTLVRQSSRLTITWTSTLNYIGYLTIVYTVIVSELYTNTSTWTRNVKITNGTLLVRRSSTIKFFLLFVTETWTRRRTMVRVTSGRMSVQGLLLVYTLVPSIWTTYDDLKLHQTMSHNTAIDCLCLPMSKENFWKKSVTKPSTSKGTS